MSIHPSLKISEKDKKVRSVLKRTERLKAMMEKEKWKEGDDVFGLPKMKTIRIRIKKEKAEKAETTGAETAATPVTEGKTPAAGAKTPAAGAKTAAPGKTSEKK